MRSRRSGDEERDEWLSADYRRRRDPSRTPILPKSLRHAPEPAPPLYGWYGALRDEVPEVDMDRDMDGPGGDSMHDFEIIHPRREQLEAAGPGSRHRDQEEYMEGVRRYVLGGAYIEESRRSSVDIGEEQDVAAVGSYEGRRWEPRSSLPPAFIGSKAADAAVWEDLKDVRPPMYDGNPLSLNRFLEKHDNWGMTVTEDMDLAKSGKYVFKRFQWHLLEVLPYLYFVATKQGNITTLKEATKWLNEQELVDAPQVAAKRLRAIKLQHDGKEIRLQNWRDFRGQYVVFCQNVEDWNEGDERFGLLNLKRVTKHEAKRAKRNHSVKMMLNKEHHKKVVNWTKANVAWDFRRQSLQIALLITVSGDREKVAIWRLGVCGSGGQKICLQATPPRMSCNDVLEWVGEEVLQESKILADNSGLQGGKRGIHYVGEGSDREAVMDPAGAKVGEHVDDDEDEDEP